MIRRWIRRCLPQPEHFERYALTRKLKPWLAHPGLWAINRRSVAGGVAAGLFCGLIPGPFQMGGALIWCVVARVNLPVAFVTTLYTNPLTIVPLYIFATAYGQLLLGNMGNVQMEPMPDWNWAANGESLLSFFDWTMSLGPALAIGLPATMFTFSSAGWILVRGISAFEW
jgi:uncharacterized protein